MDPLKKHNYFLHLISSLFVQGTDSDLLDVDPDPLVTSTDPALDPSNIKQTLDFYCFVTSS
jgi:hypothetical protein